MNVIAFDNDVAKIYADPKFKPMICRHVCVALSLRVLNVSGAAHCIDDTAEFHQQAVAHNLDETPAMRGDFRLEDLLQFGLETRARLLLVKLAKPGIADDISNKDGGETAFHYPSRFEAVIPFQAYRSSNPVAIRAPPTNRDLCSRRLSHATTHAHYQCQLWAQQRKCDTFRKAPIAVGEMDTNGVATLANLISAGFRFWYS